jgi:glucose-6-phosphate 1-dehydrogenase
VFVVFGITGDLARVMTFQALYRLERRGLLDCPIWEWRATTGRSTSSASTPGNASRTTGESIDDEIFDRFAARLSYVSGDFGDDVHLRAGRERAERLLAARSSIWRSRRRSSGW